MRRNMKRRLLGMWMILLCLMSLLASCGNSVLRQNEPSTISIKSICKIYMYQPIASVEFPSMDCMGLHDAQVEWIRNEQSRNELLAERRVSPPYKHAHFVVFPENLLEVSKQVEPNISEPSDEIVKGGGPYVNIPLPQQTPITYEEDYTGVVYLTFDDGPGKYTEQLLDILAEQQIPATFFVLGQQVEKYPELLQRIVAEGHSIGNHSFNHVYDELYSNFDNFADQVLHTSQIISEVTGEHSVLLRAPGGTYQNVDTSYYDALTEAGYILFDWNVDSGDSKGRDVSKETIINNIKQSILTKRLIVLMHDSNTHEATMQALPEIIAYYREQNYRFDRITAETSPMLSKITDKVSWDREPASKQSVASFVEAVEKLNL